eukprot:gene19732-26424_t
MGSQRFTLTNLLQDSRRNVACQAKAVLSNLKARVPNADNLLNQDIAEVARAMSAVRNTIPDKSSQLSEIDSVLMPLLELHRALFIAQPVEEQLEPSELDLLSFGVTVADFEGTAEELGCSYLSPPSSTEPSKGLVVGIKDRIIVVQNVTILRTTLSVAFILGTRTRSYLRICSIKRSCGAVDCALNAGMRGELVELGDFAGFACQDVQPQLQ